MPHGRCTLILMIMMNIFSHIGGSDYVSGRYTVTIPAGQITFPFDVPIVNDTLLEGNEYFQLVIHVRSLPKRVTRGIPGRTSVTIVDDDSKSLATVISG